MEFKSYSLETKSKESANEGSSKGHRYFDSLKFFGIIGFALGTFFAVTHGNDLAQSGISIIDNSLRTAYDFGIKSYLNGEIGYSVITLMGGLRAFLTSQSILFTILGIVFAIITALTDKPNTVIPGQPTSAKSNNQAGLPRKLLTVGLVGVISPFCLPIFNILVFKPAASLLPIPKLQIIIVLIGLLVLGFLGSLVFVILYNLFARIRRVKPKLLIHDISYVILGFVVLLWAILIINIQPLQNGDFFRLYDTCFNVKKHRIENYKIPAIRINSEELDVVSLDFTASTGENGTFQFVLFAKNAKADKRLNIEINGKIFSREFVKNNPRLFLRLVEGKLKEIEDFTLEDKIDFYNRFLKLKSILYSKGGDRDLDDSLKGAELPERQLFRLLYMLKFRWKAENVLKTIITDSNYEGSIIRFFNDIRIEEKIKKTTGGLQ